MQQAARLSTCICIFCPLSLSLVEVASTGYKRIRGFLIQALRADPNQDQTEPVGGFVRQSNTKPVCFSDDGAGVSLILWCCWYLQYHKSVLSISSLIIIISILLLSQRGTSGYGEREGDYWPQETVSVVWQSPQEAVGHIMFWYFAVIIFP